MRKYNLARLGRVTEGGVEAKRSVLSLERKLDIIAQVRKGKLQRAVAKLFDAAKSTVGDILKNREKD